MVCSSTLPSDTCPVGRECIVRESTAGHDAPPPATIALDASAPATKLRLLMDSVSSLDIVRGLRMRCASRMQGVTFACAPPCSPRGGIVVRKSKEGK